MIYCHFTKVSGGGGGGGGVEGGEGEWGGDF